MAKIEDVQAKVEAEATVVGSAVELLNGLSAALKEAGTDPEKLQALADAIDAQTHDLAAAVAANTIAGEPSAPPEAPPTSEPPADPSA